MKSSNVDTESRLVALDGLRGYAAIAVIFYHSILFFASSALGPAVVNQILVTSIWTAPPELLVARALIIVFNGETAVIVFFVLSGAVLMRSTQLKTWCEAISLPITFAIKRILRIFPALVVCLAGFYLLAEVFHWLLPALFPSTFSMSDVIWNSLLFDLRMHGPTATLRAEMMAIPLILLAVILRKKFGGSALLALLGYSLLIREIPALFFEVSPGAYSWVPYFCAGFVAAHYADSRVVRDSMSGRAWIVTLLVVVVLRGVSLSFGISTIALQTIALAFLVAGIIGEVKSSFTEFLSKPVSQYLGKISYSLYLWAVPVFYVMGIPWARNPLAKTHWVAVSMILGAVVTIITIFVAHLSAKYVERALSKWFVRRISRSRAVATA